MSAPTNAIGNAILPALFGWLLLGAWGALVGALLGAAFNPEVTR